MATSSRVVLTPAITGEFSVKGLSEASAAKASEVLQENHEKHHIFFNKDGFHSRLPWMLLDFGGWSFDVEEIGLLSCDVPCFVYLCHPSVFFSDVFTPANSPFFVTVLLT